MDEKNTETETHSGREASDLSALLSGVSLERDSMNNFKFHYPNGAMLDASMNEVLLWEIRLLLIEQDKRITILEKAAKHNAPAMQAAWMGVPIGAAR